MLCDLSYDYDLRVFKFITNGNIWMSLGPHMVQQVAIREMGTLRKKWQVNVATKLQSGDELSFFFQLPREILAWRLKDDIERIAVKGRGFDEVIRLLKTRERVPSSEVARVLSKYNLDASDQSIQRVVESAITSGKVEGVFDGKEFISKYGLQRETVRYDIVSKFEISNSGAIVITCPKCGAAIPLQGKESNGNCRYCGTPYKVPSKILDLL
jgi:predicted RNA-binding Zn-ribbon protein involved in translation (DUF1610 family)